VVRPLGGEGGARRRAAGAGAGAGGGDRDLRRGPLRGGRGGSFAGGPVGGHGEILPPPPRGSSPVSAGGWLQVSGG